MTTTAHFGDFISDALGSIEGEAQALVSGAVSSIQIESSAFFPIELDNPLAGLAGGSGGAAGGSSQPPLWQRLLRPQITVNTAVGQYVLAPGGPPPAFPWLLAAIVGVAVLATYGAIEVIEGR